MGRTTDAIRYSDLVPFLTTPYDPDEEARFWAQPPEWHAAQREARRRFAQERAEYRRWRESFAPEQVEAYWPTTARQPSGEVVAEFICQSAEHIARYG